MSHYTKALEEGDKLFDEKFIHLFNLEFTLPTEHIGTDIGFNYGDGAMIIRSSETPEKFIAVIELLKEKKLKETDFIKSFLTSFAEKIRQAVAEDDVEWCESRMKEDKHEQWFSHRNGHCKCTYNQALEEIITHKREQLTKE